MGTMTEAELVIKEEQLIRISTKVVYGVILACIAGAIWLTTISIANGQLRKDFDEHLKSGSEYRELNDRRWLRINNALIRMQERQGIVIPERERQDPLVEE